MLTIHQSIHPQSTRTSTAQEEVVQTGRQPERQCGTIAAPHGPRWRWPRVTWRIHCSVSGQWGHCASIRIGARAINWEWASKTDKNFRVWLTSLRFSFASGHQCRDICRSSGGTQESGHRHHEAGRQVVQTVQCARIRVLREFEGVAARAELFSAIFWPHSSPRASDWPWQCRTDSCQSYPNLDQFLFLPLQPCS